MASHTAMIPNEHFGVRTILYGISVPGIAIPDDRGGFLVYVFIMLLPLAERQHISTKMGSSIPDWVVVMRGDKLDYAVRPIKRRKPIHKRYTAFIQLIRNRFDIPSASLGEVYIRRDIAYAVMWSYDPAWGFSMELPQRVLMTLWLPNVGNVREWVTTDPATYLEIGGLKWHIVENLEYPILYDDLQHGRIVMLDDAVFGD